MIDPAENDIGRGVIYQPEHGSAEDGAITSYNGAWVFVRYRSQHPGTDGQATRREDLRWLSE